MTIDFTKIEEAIGKIPKETKDLLFSSELGYILEEIAELNKIEEEKYLQMVDEVGYVILGLKNRSSFTDSLVTIGIDKSNAESITKTIDQKIFSKLDSVTEKRGLSLKGDWKTKLEEVTKKYSLNEGQKTSLEKLIQDAAVQQNKPENLSKKIMSDLGISVILAEQIAEDLNSRVFDYAAKTSEEKPKSTPTPATTSSYRPMSKIPEVKPENLPMVEKGEGVKVNPPPKPATAPTPNNNPAPKSNGEFVQKPYSVPRFGMASVPPKVQVIDMTKNTPKTSQNAMDSKMNFVTTSIPKDMQKKPAPTSETPPSMPGTKYTPDPYREPLN